MFHPINGLRAGERKILREGTEPLANRIPPDVAGDGFDGIRGAEDVIIVTFLPETGGRRSPEFESSVLLEKTDEFTEV
jgi:hypothetical protein